MPESASPSFLVNPSDESETQSPSFLRVDPRIVKELNRKRPIGQSLTSWVGLLLQEAIATKPEPLIRD